MSDEATALPPPAAGGGAAFRSVMVEVTAQCPGCAGGIPVPGPVEVLVCGRCGTRCPVGPSFWRRVLADPVHEALGFPDGKGRAAQLRSEPPVRLLYGRMSPPCVGCGTLLPPQALAEAAVTSEHGDGKVFCPACGTPNRCRVVPKWFKSVHPVPGFLANEPLGASLPAACPRCDSPVPSPAETGVLQRNCMKCGAGLLQDERSAGLLGNHRWYLLSNLGGAVGVVPRDALALCDLTVGPRGAMTLAWVAASNGPRRRASLVGQLDRRGLLRWVRELAFSPRSTLHQVPTQPHLALVDPDEGLITYLNRADGEVVREVVAPEGDRDDLADVQDHRGIGFDPDGTMIVASPRFGGAPQLARFEASGKRVPLWQGMGPEEEVMRFRARADVPALDELGDRPLRLPDDTLLCVGWDQHVYLLDRDGTLCLRYDRAGQLAGRIEIAGDDVVGRVLAAGADADGTVHLLFRHRRKLGDSEPEHVARLRPDGQLEVWLGIHAPRSPLILGPEPERMKVGMDGAVLLGGALPQIVLLDDARQVLWHHPGRLRHQRRALEAPERRGRRGGRVRRISSVNTVAPR